MKIYNTIFLLRKMYMYCRKLFWKLFFKTILTLSKILLKTILKILSQNTFQKYFENRITIFRKTNLPITGNMLEALYMYISAVIHSIGTWRLGCLPQR